MAKLDMTVQLKKDDGTSLGGPIAVSNQPSGSAAHQAVANVIAARRAAAQTNANDLVDAENAFNS